VRPYSGGVRHDYKDPLTSASAVRVRPWWWFVVGMCLPLVGVSVLLINEPDEPLVLPPTRTPARVALLEPTPEASHSLPVAAPTRAEPLDEAPAAGPRPPAAGDSLDLVIKRGESLDLLFGRHDLNRSDLAAMLALPEAAEPLRKVRPGDEIGIVALDGRVLSLHRELDDFNDLWITKSPSGDFAATVVARKVDLRTVAAHGTIRTSLFEAAVGAGLADAVTMNMAGIFQWDIDFIQDVRVGDNFTVIHEELWRDGVKLRNGQIVAAEFVNRGRAYRAARYTDGSGRSDYYTPEGRSVRKAFIRAPVDFTRISGTFNPNRRHPILNTIRAHRGVDYAAPTGTPVKAAGDGTVDFRGVNGGYGNAIVLRHGGNITTLYAHLSRFGSYRVGARIKQGDIVGYVGQTGLATGPHLHYEYRVDGVHRNPRTVSLPDADPVPPEYQADFEATTATLWRQLDLYVETRLASAAE
jgi:murein DD-endopeptidase MepM/ murein hydrolase activator NlpD